MRLEGTGADEGAGAAVWFGVAPEGDALAVTVSSPSGGVELQLGDDGSVVGLAEDGGGPALDEMLDDVEPHLDDVIRVAEDSAASATGDGARIEALSWPTLNWRCAFAKLRDVRRPSSEGAGSSASCRLFTPTAPARPRCPDSFTYGTNYAWHQYGADFGGIAEWHELGVASDRATFLRELRAMRAAGARMVRWWIFPELMNDGIYYDGSDVPIAVKPALLEDIAVALELADEADVDLMFTFFSFASMGRTHTDGGVVRHSLRPMVMDAAKRRQLVAALVVPIARMVESSPRRSRMRAWDVMNEPEWALDLTSPHSARPFLLGYDLETVHEPDMQAFMRDVVRGLRSASSAQITIGSAGLPWAGAWAGVDLDFDSVHQYDWMRTLMPAGATLSGAGLTSRPVMLTEYPNAGLAGTLAQPRGDALSVAADAAAQGYVGALTWAYNDPAFPWTERLFPELVRGTSCD